MYLIIHQIIPELNLEDLEEETIKCIYSDFIRFVDNRTKLLTNINSLGLPARLRPLKFPTLQQNFRRIQVLKVQKRSIKPTIWSRHNIHVHRVMQPPMPGASSSRKKIVLHLPGEVVAESRFPTDNYYHLKWSASNTICPKRNSPEFHVIVLDETAPKSVVVKRIIQAHGDITRMSWVTGVVVYNLFEGDRFPNFLEKYGKMAEHNIRFRSKVKRGTTRDSK